MSPSAFPCPTCEAKPGEPCRTPGGCARCGPEYYHEARERRARIQTAAAELEERLDQRGENLGLRLCPFDHKAILSQDGAPSRLADGLYLEYRGMGDGGPPIFWVECYGCGGHGPPSPSPEAAMAAWGIADEVDVAVGRIVVGHTQLLEEPSRAAFDKYERTRRQQDGSSDDQ